MISKILIVGLGSIGRKHLEISRSIFPNADIRYFKSLMKKLCKQKFKNFGENSEFRPGSYAEACSKISIGNNVVIRPGSFIYADPSDNGGGITIEDDVLLGSSIHIYTNNHKFDDSSISILYQEYPKPSKKNSVIIGKGAWIGAGVIILAGVKIGKNAVIGAGTIVTKSVPEKVVFAGNPGKVIRQIF